MIKINSIGYDVASFLYIQEKDHKYNDFLKFIFLNLHLRPEGIFYDDGNFESRNCEIQESDVNVLIETLAESKSEIFKALSYDILHTQTRKNEHAYCAAENYLSFLSNNDNYDLSIIGLFCKRIIIICSKDKDVFNDILMSLNKYVYTLIKKNKIDDLIAYNILSKNKYMTKGEHSLFARKFYKNALLLCSGITLALDNEIDDFRLNGVVQNIKLSFDLSIKLYKKINDAKLINKLHFKSLILFWDLLNLLDCKKYSNSYVSCIFFAEQSIKLTPKNLLRTNNFNIAHFEFEIQKMKSILIDAQEPIELDMSNIKNNIECAVSNTKSYHQALLLMSQYTSNVSHHHINKDDDSLNKLFQQVIITSDGRTSAIGGESNMNAILYYSFHGFVIKIYKMEIYNKYGVDKEHLKEMIQKSINIPEEIKSFVCTGIERWLLDDMISSSFILIPLYEALLRDILKKENISTQTNNNGSQDEKSLSGLINSELEMKNIINQNLIIEMKELMIVKTGSNIRNKISHALIRDDEIHSSLYDFLCWRWLTILTESFNLKQN